MKHFKIIVAFAGHILSAVAVFIAIGFGAWAVHLFRHWLEAAGLDAIVLTGLHGLELILFFCDLLATTAWAIKAAGKAIRDILSD